jgi:hypothetical protein
MADFRGLMDRPEEWPTLRYDDPRLDAFAEAVEDKYELPPGILVALKNAGERTPNEDGRWASSHKGASGLMQFMPDTMRLQDGKFMHDPQNPFESLVAAGRYVQHTLKYQYKGDVAKAIADYNAGGPRVSEWARGERELPEETRGYIVRVNDYITNNYRERLAQRLAARQQRREQDAGQ